MSNTFRFKYDPARLQKHFRLAEPPPPFDDGGTDVEAGRAVATIEWSVYGRPIMQMARFGFQMRDGVLPMTHYRCESIKAFAPSRPFVEGRCVVPADLFSAQVATPDGFRLASYAARDKDILALAAMLRPEAQGLSVTILTVPAAGIVKSATRRMPALLNKEDYDLWFDDTTDTIDVLALLGRSHDHLLVECAA